MDQFLYVEDDFAAPFTKLKVGEKVTLMVEAVVANSGAIPTFENVEGKPEARQMGFTQFVIQSVSKGGKVVAEQTEEEIEQAIYDAKMGDYDQRLVGDESPEQSARRAKRANDVNRFLRDGEAMAEHVGDLDEMNGFERGHSVPPDWGPEDKSKRPKSVRRQVFTR